MIIGIDVDGVTHNTDFAWEQWLCSNYGVSIEYLNNILFEEGSLDYNLSKHFPNFEMVTGGLEPYAFFKLDGLYHTNKHKVQLKDGAYETIKYLHEAGNTIPFVSHCQAEHISSKVKSLKKEFPFLEFGIGAKDGFIATKQKHHVRVNAFIDNRAYNLNNMPDDVIKIYFSTYYRDKDFIKGKYDLVTSIENPWLDIKNFFESIA